MSDELEQVGALDGIAAGEHEDRDLERFDLVDKLLAFVGAELHGVALGLRGGAAVHAGEVAGLCHFPDGDEGALVEVDGVDERVHDLMKPDSDGGRSDESLSIDRIET